MFKNKVPLVLYISDGAEVKRSPGTDSGRILSPRLMTWHTATWMASEKANKRGRIIPVHNEIFNMATFQHSLGSYHCGLLARCCIQLID